MDKNILFYSNFCNHSKELLRNINQNPIKNSLIFVCVDDRNIQIPPFIKVVPTIYLTNNKSILTNNEITNWINQHGKQESEDILAYNGSNMSSLSTNFSFLEEGNDLISNQYTFINQTESINTPKELNSDNSQNSELSKDFERLQNLRNNDSYSQGIQRM